MEAGKTKKVFSFFDISHSDKKKDDSSRGINQPCTSLPKDHWGKESRKYPPPTSLHVILFPK